MTSGADALTDLILIWDIFINKWYFMRNIIVNKVMSWIKWSYNDEYISNLSMIYSFWFWHYCVSSARSEVGTPCYAYIIMNIYCVLNNLATFILTWDSSIMEHHVEIGVWALVWCLWVFLYSILSLQLYLMDLWGNEHIDDEDSEWRCQ